MSRPMLQSRTLAAAAAALGILTACSAQENLPPDAPRAPVAEEPAPPPSAASPNAAESVAPTGEVAAHLDRSPLGVFEGTLPCADCAGIRTELTLFLQPDTFTLRETYLGAADGEKTITSEGTWQAALGAADDPDATVIRIEPGDPDSSRSFREVGGDRLELLGRDGRKIDSALDYTLTRRGEPEGGP